MNKLKEYLIEDKVLILTEKEYVPNFKDDVCYCFDSLNYQNVFNWSIIFNKMNDAFVYFKYQVDFNNRPKDYIFLEANDKYEEITCYRKKDIIGKKITEILDRKKDTAQELIKKFYKTAINGAEQNFNLSSKLTGKNYSAFAYSPLKNFFAITFKETPDTADMKKRYQNYYIKVTDILNQVCTSQAIITELENPYKLKNTIKLGMISLDVAKYLGILDKNIKLKKPILVTGLNKIILSSDKNFSLEKLKSRKINILSKYEYPDKKIKNIDIYFMINR
ncbi:MAG: PAS domain-containing protein [Candidatus Humimicrobiaceae bacterium]